MRCSDTNRKGKIKEGQRTMKERSIRKKKTIKNRLMYFWHYVSISGEGNAAMMRERSVVRRGVHM